MKCRFNNAVLVEKKDFEYLDTIPKYIKEEYEQNVKEDHLFVCFKSQDAIDFFDNRTDLIDYNKIKYMNDEGIDDLIQMAKKQVLKYSNLWVNIKSGSEKREIEFKRKEYHHQVSDYNNYKAKRNIYDKEIKSYSKTLSLK